VIGTKDSIVEAVRRLLPNLAPFTSAEPLSRGYGGESWLVRAGHQELLAKIAVRSPEGQRLANAIRAIELAQTVGVPAPPYLAVSHLEGAFGGRSFSVSEFWPGEDGEDAVPRMGASERESYFRAFGQAAARLHAVQGPGFCSDLAAVSAVGDWGQFVAGRLAGKEAAFADELRPTAERAIREICDLASSLSAVVRPSLLHNDLYLPNTLTLDAAFSAILDFEYARWWDAVHDFVKPGWLVFEEFPEGKALFYEGYGALPDRFEERFRVAQGIELLSAIPFFARWDDKAMCERYAAMLEAQF
jgi:aminoglycoside phosphotransferase (APT) family kinase protein